MHRCMRTTAKTGSRKTEMTRRAPQGTRWGLRRAKAGRIALCRVWLGATTGRPHFSRRASLHQAIFFQVNDERARLDHVSGEIDLRGLVLKVLFVLVLVLRRLQLRLLPRL